MCTLHWSRECVYCVYVRMCVRTYICMYICLRNCSDGCRIKASDVACCGLATTTGG